MVYNDVKFYSKRLFNGYKYLGINNKKHLESVSNVSYSHWELNSGVIVVSNELDVLICNF